MSLQDDYYDLADHLKGKPEADMLERIWFGFCDLETADMARKKQISQGDYEAWRKNMVEKLKL